MRETASNLLLDSDAIERERGVIASEKSARDSLQFRAQVNQIGFFSQGSGLIDRLPIGKDETIATMPREEFVAFYEGYYRPENTFIAFIGDLDTDIAIAKIEEYFGSWEGTGTPLPNAPASSALLTPGKVGYYHDDGLLTSVTLASLKPYEDLPDTVAKRRDNFIRGVGLRILNRRLQRKLDNGTAQYLGASSGRFNAQETVDGTLLLVRTSPDGWQAAMADADQELRRALEHGFLQQELDEALANSRQSRETAVERADTRKTFANLEYNYAAALVDAYADERVFTSPQTNLELFEQQAASLTLDEVESVFREMWAGYDEPAIYFASGEPLDQPEAALRSALQASQQIDVAPFEQPPLADFAYTDFGPAGAIVAEQYVEGADAYLIEFANNVRLNFKQTDFDDGTIFVRARVGGGFMSLPRKDEGLRRLGLNLIDQSGVVGHTADDLQTLFAGRRVNVSTKTRKDNDAFELLGTTDADDLSAQLNLMTAKVTAPAFSDEIAEQYRRKMRAWYPTHDSSPESVASKYLPRLIRAGDTRYGYDDLDNFLAPTVAEVRDWIEPQLETGPIEITVVGDIDKDTVVAEIARTFGALAPRADVEADFGTMSTLQFAQGNDTPYRYYHNGTEDQAQVFVYWPAPDASDPADAYRMRLLRGLFRNRLTDVLREEMGATYSPGAAFYSNSLFAGFGYIYARVTAKPNEVEAVREGILRVADEMASVPIDEDNFLRAWTPLVEDLDSSLESNGYWLEVLGDAQTGGEGLTSHYLREPTYRTMTAGDISALASEIFGSDNTISAFILPTAASQ